MAAYGVSLCHHLEKKGWLALEKSVALQRIQCHPATVTTFYSVPSHPLSHLCLGGFVLYLIWQVKKLLIVAHTDLLW